MQVSNPGRLVKRRHSIWLIQIERTGRHWHEKLPTSKTRRNSSPSLKNSIKLLKNAKTSFAVGSQKELPQKERAATNFSSWMMNREHSADAAADFRGARISRAGRSQCFGGTR